MARGASGPTNHLNDKAEVQFWVLKCGHNGYTLAMTRKGVAFMIMVNEDLRRAFVDACRQQDRLPAQVVCEFMRAICRSIS